MTEPDEAELLESKVLDHLGLGAGMFEELGIGAWFYEHIAQDFDLTFRTPAPGGTDMFLGITLYK